MNSLFFLEKKQQILMLINTELILNNVIYFFLWKQYTNIEEFLEKCLFVYEKTTRVANTNIRT